MRPLELTIDRFTCFRERTTIDFRPLGVFGISGATGAGKTSILDAITFALYGRVARVGKSCTSLISLGRDRLSVSLRFQVGPRTFSIARTLKRAGGSTAQIDDVDSQECLADGVREVDRRVEALLGMPFETFTQAVMLPQGEFAKFLRASAAERTKILRDLLRLDVYDRMRKRAFAREKESGLKAKILSEQLTAHFGGATDERIGELERALLGERNEVERARVALEGQNVTLAEMRRRRTATVALDRATDARRALDADLAKVAGTRAEIDAAARAEPVRLPLAALDAAEREAKERIEACAKADRSRETAASRRAELRSERERAAARAAEVPELAARIVALDRIAADVDALARVETELSSRRGRLARDEAALASLAAEVDALARADRTARKAESDAKAKVAATSPPGAAEAIESAGDLARSFEEERRRTSEVTKELEREAAKLAKRREARATLADDEQRARGDVEAKAQAHDHHRAALEKARRVEHVRHLRSSLAVGEPCPVCEREVESKPRLPRAANSTGVVEKEREAEEALREAREQASKLSARLAQIDEELGAAVEAFEERSRENLERVKRVEADETALAERLGEQVARLPPGPTLARRVLAKVAELQASARVRAEAQAELSRRSKAAHDAAAALSRATGEVEKSTAVLELARSEIGKLERASADTRARISDVTSHPDPHAERAELALRRETIEAALVDLAARERAIEAEELRTEAIWKAAESEHRSAAARVAKAREDAQAAVDRAGVASLEEAARALRSPEALTALRASVERHERALADLDADVARLRADLEAGRVEQAELDACERATESIAGELSRAHRTVGAREQEIAATRADVAKADKVRDDLAVAAKERDLYGELAGDLGTAALQQHLQGSVVRELVGHASTRMAKLSRGRYDLVVKDDDFWVVDHENASAARPAATLSGGETFLASLALALSLSDQVQQSAGAVRLESLFVDEGFGTLDPEALDVAAEAVESLEAGGRMVGIISHLPELNQRMRAEIVVERSPSGAAIRLKV